MRSIRRRISFFMVMSSLFALLAGVILTIYLYESKVRRQSIRELNTIVGDIPAQIGMLSEELGVTGKALAFSQDVHEYIEHSDQQVLFADLIRFLRTNHLDYAEITDASGTILVNLVDSLSTGQQSRNPLVPLALRGNPFGHGNFRYGDNIYLLATLPIREADRLIGTITIGKLFNQHLLGKLANVPEVHLALWNRIGRKAVVPVDGNPLPSLATLLNNDEIDILNTGGTINKTIRVDGETFQCIFFTIGEIRGGTAEYWAGYRSMRFLKEAGQLTLVQSIALALLILALTTQFVFWITRRVIHPLEELTDLTREMANFDFRKKVPVQGNDEIASLATSFNNLSKALQENIAKKDRYAAELAKLNTDLENLVAKRTEELEHSNLRLKREVEEKNDFLRAVSHDLGAPLRNIGGLTRLLEKKYAANLGEDGADKVKRIRNNVKRELAMIHQLLELSRLKTRPSRVEEIDLMRLLSQIRQDFSAILEEKKIRIVVLDLFPKIRAAREQIRQIFQNLIDNAIKYLGDQPEPEIAIGWSANPDTHMFWVSDNGIGIPEEKKKEIFGVFRRIQRRETEAVEGMGIGLAAVKAVVGLYGGDIWVDSEIGKGSTFYFTLKRSIVDLESSAEAIAEINDEMTLTEPYAEDSIS